MPCPLCGEDCRCNAEATPAESLRWLPHAESDLAPAQVSPETEASSLTSSGSALDSSQPALSAADACDSAAEDSSAWRQELAGRLNRYQARRKPRPPRYPSLRLRFEEPYSISEAEPPASVSPTASQQALPVDRFAGSAARALEFETLPDTKKEESLSPAGTADGMIHHAPTTAKIIEFPRSWTPPPAPLDQLAEPVIDRPRILEAPEVVPPPPALGGILIEPARQPEVEKRPGIDIPLQSAPLSRRIMSAAIDAVIVAVACAVFGLIFSRMSSSYPPPVQIAVLAAGFICLFWAAYQYLLLVYCGGTPGLRLAGLQLARFDGRPANRRLRRWRVLASFLSAISLGMGYGWVFLDEDALCWHDRITHTYLAPRTE